MKNLADYYMDAPLYNMPHIEQREFGIIKKGQMMWRHHSFKDMGKLRGFLIQHQPLHVYFSSARYEHPSARPPEGEPIMIGKGWLGADLVFDIDNDHLPDKSLGNAAFHAMHLIEVLKDNFAFKDMMLVFSGSRGYHVHVRDECIQSFNSLCRREVADYFMEYFPNGMENPRYVGIDAPVTIDTARLIRLPGSIHGGTMQPCSVVGNQPMVV